MGKLFRAIIDIFKSDPRDIGVIRGSDSSGPSLPKKSKSFWKRNKRGLGIGGVVLGGLSLGLLLKSRKKKEGEDHDCCEDDDKNE